MVKGEEKLSLASYPMLATYPKDMQENSQSIEICK